MVRFFDCGSGDTYYFKTTEEAQKFIKEYGNRWYDEFGEFPNSHDNDSDYWVEEFEFTTADAAILDYFK